MYAGAAGHALEYFTDLGTVCVCLCIYYEKDLDWDCVIMLNDEYLHQLQYGIVLSSSYPMGHNSAAVLYFNINS